MCEQTKKTWTKQDADLPARPRVNTVIVCHTGKCEWDKYFLMKGLNCCPYSMNAWDQVKKWMPLGYTHAWTKLSRQQKTTWCEICNIWSQVGHDTRNYKQ